MCVGGGGVGGGVAGGVGMWGCGGGGVGLGWVRYKINMIIDLIH